MSGDGVGSAPDSFIYRATSGSSSATATVAITISPLIPAATVAAINVYTVIQGTACLPSRRELANDTTASGTLTASLVTTVRTLSLNADGSFTYVHDGVGSAPIDLHRATGSSSATATVP
jgi:hypothetical protein